MCVLTRSPRMDGPTDQRTDIASHGFACPQLKKTFNQKTLLRQCNHFTCMISLFIDIPAQISLIKSSYHEPSWCIFILFVNVVFDEISFLPKLILRAGSAGYRSWRKISQPNWTYSSAGSNKSCPVSHAVDTFLFNSSLDWENGLKGWRAT